MVTAFTVFELLRGKTNWGEGGGVKLSPTQISAGLVSFLFLS